MKACMEVNRRRASVVRTKAVIPDFLPDAPATAWTYDLASMRRETLAHEDSACNRQELSRELNCPNTP